MKKTSFDQVTRLARERLERSDVWMHPKLVRAIVRHVFELFQGVQYEEFRTSIRRFTSKESRNKEDDLEVMRACYPRTQLNHQRTYLANIAPRRKVQKRTFEAKHKAKERRIAWLTNSELLELTRHTNRLAKKGENSVLLSALNKALQTCRK